MKRILAVLLVLALAARIAADDAESKDQRLRAAIQKLWEPLDSKHEFWLDLIRPGRVDFWRGADVGKLHVHGSIDERMTRAPADAFKTIAMYQIGNEGTSLLGRLQSRKPPMTPRRDLFLQWITNQLQAINLTLDHLEPSAKQVEHLEKTKRALINERRAYQKYYYGPPRRSGVSAKEVQAALDPGTIILLYLGTRSPPEWDGGFTKYPPPDHFDLVVLGRDRIEAHRIALTEEKLYRLLEDLLPVRIHPRAGLPEMSAQHRQAEMPAERQLYDALIAPAEKAIAASERVVIVPDGLLYSVPFAALARPAEDGTSSYFVEWKPIHVAQSIAVYLQLLARRERSERVDVRSSRRLLAVGDPSRPAVRRGQGAGAERLPGTRREVNVVADLFRRAGAPVDVLLGSHAGEKEVKEKASRAAYLHFATHGVSDPVEFEQSYLALTVPQGLALIEADGILEAWEVADQLEIQADLVTLSACETALGIEGWGDGVLSLAHAFQLAGAQSVIASLWRVSDDSTADLMARFYRNLLSGLPKDRALQEAQVAMLRGASGQGRALPFQWAAFQLIGDWR